MTLLFLLLLLVQTTLSKPQKFSKFYSELNEFFGKNLSHPQPSYKMSCSNNRWCLENDRNTFCDRFLGENSTKEGSFCIPIPIIQNNIKLIAEPAEIGFRRCTSFRSCGKDEVCLIPNSNSLIQGFCGKVAICSRGRAASHNSAVAVPNHKSICKNYTTSEEFRLSYFKNGLERKSRQIETCCSEPIGGRCLHGEIIDPLERCFENSDCFTDFHESEEWCDDTTKLCCSDQYNDRSIRCPDGITYPFMEEKCISYNENIPSSGICPKIGVNATCLHGHCCPAVSLPEKKGEPLRYQTTYETGIPCDPSQPLRRIPYSFCDTLARNVVVLGETDYEELSNGENRTACFNN
ncbi:hypothetical protein B9Z55_009561 [Caenorhabditis nigoni]|nr:hypothetical protein B9Z55_009561 [Caenorhabditis nigoni]